MSRTGVVLLIVACLLTASTAFAGPGWVNLPQTGQTVCYALGDPYDYVTGCPGTGQDGEIQAGVPWSLPQRFIDHGDGTVTDTLTGLMWTKNANSPVNESACPDSGGSTTFCSWHVNNAHIDFCLNQDGYAGHNDWRLPTILELESLTMPTELNGGGLGWLQGTFTGIHSTDGDFTYISSTASAGTAGSVWAGDGFNGTSGIEPCESEYFYYWPVRTTDAAVSANTDYFGHYWWDDILGNPVAPAPAPVWHVNGVEWGLPGDLARFVDHGDGTVTDNLSGLMWTENANAPGVSTSNSACSSLVGSAMTWNEARNTFIPDCMNAPARYGYSDWRLPNRKELLSLVDFTRYNPALTTGHPFQGLQAQANDYYLSSTAYKMPNQNPSTYWPVNITTVGFQKGVTSRADPDIAPYGYEGFVWPVRGGITSDTTADLAVAISYSPDPVAPGVTLTHTITITNNGPGTATDIDVELWNFPSGAIFTANGGGTCSSLQPPCHYSTMGSGSSKTITVISTAPPVSAQGPLQVLASAYSASYDPDITNNEYVVKATMIQSTLDVNATGNGTIAGTGISCPGDCSEQFTTAQSVVLASSSSVGYALENWTGCDSVTSTTCTVDMSTNHTVSAEFVVANAALGIGIDSNPTTDVILDEHLTFTIPITNSGPTSASNVRVELPLDPYVSFVSASSTQGTCVKPKGLPPFRVVCSIGDVIKGGRGIPLPTITIVVKADAISGHIAHTATIYSAVGTNPDVVGGTATKNNAIKSQLNVAIDPAGGGTVTATNVNCPGDCNELYSTAANVDLTATPAAGKMLLNWSGCNSTNGNVCTINTGANKNVTATFVPNSGADLAVTKTADLNDVDLGNNVTYTITVTNNGPETANAVILTDVLPTQLTFGSANSTQGSCLNNSGTVTCTIGTMANGAVVTIALVASASTASIVCPNATVSSSTADNQPSNNTVNTICTSLWSTLNVAVSPETGGMVTSPGIINCPGTSCSWKSRDNGAVTLAATPGDNVFSHWTGCDSIEAGTGNCQVTMETNKNVTAHYSCATAWLFGTPSYESSIASAYNALTENDRIIRAAAGGTGEDLTLGDNWRVTLEGGYDCGFTTNAGQSTRLSALTVSSGTVTIEQIEIW